MPLRIGIATCTDLPEPDRDQELLLDALRDAGASADLLAWDDPAIAWESVDLAVIRSTWNYHHTLDAFLAWADATSAKTQLLNPASVVRWNTHKRYLLDLEAKGTRVVPTELVPRGAPHPSLAELCARRGFGDVVVKPAVSAGSYETHKIHAADHTRGDAVLTRLARERDVLVQSYVASVEGYGERSLIFIDGALSHAMRKSPRFADGVEQVTGPLPIADDERTFAERLLASIDAPLLYGRVDVARDEEGAPMLMELELVEPSLFLAQHPPALARFVEAILRSARLSGSPAP
ncbi:hypothetical protein L6R52_03560 [Myxococcota bacterium]|nr:hypothetical protein [Myxococcota bacterium]